MDKFAPLLSVHLTIVKRVIFQRFSSFFLLCLIASVPLIVALPQKSQIEKGLVVILFSCHFFLMTGLMKRAETAQIQLFQIKIYPLPNRLVFQLLWAIESLDYNLLMVIVPAMGLVLMLFPDFETIFLCLTCMAMCYALMTLLLSIVKILNSIFPPSIHVVNWAIGLFGFISILVWLFVTELNLYASIYVFVSNWQILIFSFAAFILVTLYKTGTFLVSKLSK